jgi:hypothetical protein
MVNSTCKFSMVQADVTRHKLISTNSNRWYYDGSIDHTNSHCLYPHYNFCSGLGIDFSEMNKRLGIDSLQYMEKTGQTGKTEKTEGRQKSKADSNLSLTKTYKSTTCW